MQEIIQKSIKGGYTRAGLQYANDPSDMSHWKDRDYFLDPLFWQALGKACGRQPNGLSEKWMIRTGCPDKKEGCLVCHYEQKWKDNALRFHEINLTESWDAAIAYLSALIK